MKKKILFLSTLLCTMVIASCQKEGTKPLIDRRMSLEKYIPAPISLPSSSIEWDESYHPNASLTKSINYSSEMAVTTSNIYLGGVFTAASIENLTFVRVNKPVKPITVAYTFPGFFIDVINTPSISGQYLSLNKAINSSAFSGKQSLSFEYDFRQFSNYNEMKLAFGANVNIASILKLNASYDEMQVKQQTGLFARVVQKNFSMLMDYPEDGIIFKVNSDLEATADLSPLYINSIIFGRMGIIAIESSSSYEDVKTAFKLALNAKIVSGELSFEESAKRLLERADIKIFISGGKSGEVAQVASGFHEFQNFIISGGEFSKEVPGVPIFFTANYASDNSVFSTSFTAQ